MILKSGIPTVNDYLKLKEEDKKTSWFAKKSEAFVSTHSNKLQYYFKKWTKDPFFSWSRIWEYQYVFQEIKNIKKKDLKILDAGSGVTFFSKLVSEEFNSKVMCCDYDKNLASIYKKINTKNVSFKYQDIRKLDFKDNSFDVIYCISVIEHTNAYEEIIKEFKRVLKKNGVLILTFDISIDGEDDISIKKSNKLLGLLDKHFSTKSSLKFDDMVTTDFVRKINPELLPGNLNFVQKIRYYLGHIIRFKLPKEKYKLTTFYCDKYKKTN